MSTNDFLLVLSTFPGIGPAASLARALVEAGHAACVNIVPGVRSIYLWEGAVQADDEVLMILKTTASRFPALREALVAGHPYELPEVVAVAVEDGYRPYLDWIAAPRAPARGGS